jgi:hypothetical protein
LVGCPAKRPRTGWSRPGGALIGMKPPQFAIWLFAQLGARAGDELVDLYPSSGAVTEAWRRYTATAHAAQAV